MTGPVLEIQTCQLKVPIPQEAKVIVNKGDTVAFDEVIAESQETFQEFSLAKILKESPQNVGKYLLISPGAQLKEGEVIAVKKSLFSNSFFKSPVTGVFTELLPEGYMRVKIGKKQEIKAPCKAKVTHIEDNDSITLECEAAVLTGNFGTGLEKWGVIDILDKQEEVELSDLSANACGRIFVSPGKVSQGFIHKAEALDAIGVLGNNLEGQVKTMELTLVMVGESQDLIPEEVWKTLKKHEGKKALISGSEKTLKIPLN